jgi:hypothetical protein
MSQRPGTAVFQAVRGEEHTMSDLRYPEWQTAYLAAISELDDTKLAARAMDAEEAIFRRFQALGTSSDHHEERLALEDAIRGLRVLRRDKLKFPDWK